MAWAHSETLNLIFKSVFMTRPHYIYQTCYFVLLRDQLEEWSAAEATLFEDAYDKYGKDFHDIRTDCVSF